MLEEAQDVGFNYVVWSEGTMPGWPVIPSDLSFFDTYGAAQEHWQDLTIFDDTPVWEEAPVYYFRSVEVMLEDIKKANGLTKEQDMNYNNLENLKDELSKLGFGKKVAEDMQKQMEKGAGSFELHDRVMGSKGQVDLTLHFRQSGQSENYYLNKYDVRLLNGKPLAEGEKYLVIRPNEKEPGKNDVKSFDQVEQAISFFKVQHGDALLAAGKDAGHKTDLARMEQGNVNYLEKDFARTYKNPGIGQTFFVERGKGFTAEQAVNLIQGRAVFRDDLIKLGGEPYAAWNKLDMDNQKDRYHNFQMLQYHVPTYGFILKDTLDKFQIKEMGDEQKAGKLMRELEKGNRPLVTVLKGDHEQKLFMETSPRYGQLNFFREDGRPEKREQFLKPEHQQEIKLGKEKGQAKEQEQGLTV
ncbi:hypothetical protein [Mucilaginibacter sp. NFX135]|uniref:hypothetical protein n=1 Tax=Mucilaginibacter sp. NFX135 TaxID=3402687 RepID=UPI003AFACD85